MGVNESEVIKIYKQVLAGKNRKIFPKGFWVNSDEENIIIGNTLVKFLIDDLLGWNDKELCKKINRNVLIEYGLNQVLKIIHNQSVFNTINSAYPDKFKPWEIDSVKSVPHNYWDNDDNIIKAIRWLVETKLKCSNDGCIVNISSDMFDNNKVSTVLDLFGGSPFKAINKAYPERFKMWQFKSVSRNYWKDDNNIKEAIEWLIKEKLKKTNCNIIFLSMNDFIDNDLSSLYKNRFRCKNALLLEKLNKLFPDKTFLFKKYYKGCSSF